MGADFGLFVDSGGDFIVPWTELFCRGAVFCCELVGCGRGSGGSHKAWQVLGLVFSDSAECHRQHHSERQPAAEPHFCQSADEVVLEAEADVESAVDAFDRRAFFVFALPFAT